MGVSFNWGTLGGRHVGGDSTSLCVSGMQAVLGPFFDQTRRRQPSVPVGVRRRNMVLQKPQASCSVNNRKDNCCFQLSRSSSLRVWPRASLLLAGASEWIPEPDSGE